MVKKVLITAAHTDKAATVASLLKDYDVIYADSSLHANLIPLAEKPSYAHELLSFCLDKQIDIVFPIRTAELKALAEAKVLFSEYHIHLAIPDLLQLHKLLNIQDILEEETLNAYQVENYTSLSKTLLELGYPDEKLLIGRADQEGELIWIDDSQDDFSHTFAGIDKLSFLQIGKLFNNQKFIPLSVFKPDTTVFKLHVLKLEGKTYIKEQADDTYLNKITRTLNKLQLSGYYEITFAGEKIVRIKPDTIK